MNPDAIKAKATLLGVKFRHHDESVLMGIAGCYHHLRGNHLFSRTTYVTFHPYIFIPNGLVAPNWIVIDHELVHWERQRDYGVYCWTRKYLSSWEFREQEEKPAFLRDIKNGRLSVDQCVKALRGRLYGVQTAPDELRAWFEEQLAIRVPSRDGV